MTITKSIGSAGGRDYSTLQAWEDARPATLTDAEVGECYNDSEFVSSTTLLTISGITTSATNTLTLKCAAGQSFRDNANVRSNALRYNASNGVGIRTTTSYTVTIVNTTVQYVRLDGLQIAAKSTGVSQAMDGRVNNWIVTNCIFEYFMQNNVNNSGLHINGGEVSNCLVIDYGTGAGSALKSTDGTTQAVRYTNVTVVRVSGTPSTSFAFRVAYGTASIMKNCAGFGFGGFNSRDAAFATGLNNASDKAIGFGSSNQASVTFSAQFQAITSSGPDLRALNTGNLYNNGVTDATYGTPDISNTARPISTSYDIGCWEASAAAAAFMARQGLIVQQAINRASTF